jgi:hypothetical protein
MWFLYTDDKPFAGTPIAVYITTRMSKTMHHVYSSRGYIFSQWRAKKSDRVENSKKTQKKKKQKQTRKLNRRNARLRLET